MTRGAKIDEPKISPPRRGGFFAAPSTFDNSSSSRGVRGKASFEKHSTVGSIERRFHRFMANRGWILSKKRYRLGGRRRRNDGNKSRDCVDTGCPISRKPLSPQTGPVILRPAVGHVYGAYCFGDVCREHISPRSIGYALPSPLIGPVSKLPSSLNNGDKLGATLAGSCHNHRQHASNPNQHRRWFRHYRCCAAHSNLTALKGINRN